MPPKRPLAKKSQSGRQDASSDFSLNISGAFQPPLTSTPAIGLTRRRNETSPAATPSQRALRSLRSRPAGAVPVRGSTLVVFLTCAISGGTSTLAAPKSVRIQVEPPTIVEETGDGDNDETVENEAVRLSVNATNRKRRSVSKKKQSKQSRSRASNLWLVPGLKRSSAIGALDDALDVVHEVFQEEFDACRQRNVRADLNSSFLAFRDVVLDKIRQGYALKELQRKILRCQNDLRRQRSALFKLQLERRRVEDLKRAQALDEAKKADIRQLVDSFNVLRELPAVRC